MSFDPNSAQAKAIGTYMQNISRTGTAVKQLANALQADYNFVWNNPLLTPQQALDLIQAQALQMGSSAVDALTAQVAGIAFVNSITPNIVPASFTAPPTGKTLTPNQDKSLTAGVTA